ncbi:hypothetical protein ABFX02_14G108100 [Erythranthe guttata]
MAANSNLSSPTRSPATEEDDAKEAIQFIEETTRNAGDVQKNVLAEILTQNADTEYLKGFNLAGATDRKTFKSKVPVVTYDDLQPLIHRIADGDTSPILSAHPISEFILSSGTSSGEPKLIPYTKDESDRRLRLCSLITPILNLHVNGLDKGKTLMFMYTKPEIKTKGGIIARTTATSLFKTNLFKTRPYNSSNNVHTSPIEAILCGDPFQSTYTQMLCGLYERERILRVGTSFAYGLIRIIKFLKNHWRELTHDIRTGSLHPKVSDPSIRGCMTRVIRPDPDLADLIARECADDNCEGFIKRIWPNTKFLDVIVTGNMSRYIPTLDYYSGGLPKASTIYASSECYYGLNLDPLSDGASEISYTLMPNMAYFEFLPLVVRDQREVLVDLVDVEIGKEYEVVITTFAGLYRYRGGDILQVTGFHNSAPKFKIIGRKNVVLNIDWEKTSEVELQAAVESASQLLQEFNTSVVEYTSFADTTKIPGHYVIYWELLLPTKGDSVNLPSDGVVLENCCLAMEESLNPMYRLLRVEGSIGPLEIRLVKSGTFEEVMNHAISRPGASISQYKVPRCVSSKPIVELLDSRVVSTHLSPSLPKWNSEFIKF